MTMQDTRIAGVEEALARARELRGGVAKAVATARVELTELENNNRQLRDELELIEGSAGLRAFASVRQGALRVAEWIRHPLWSAGTVGRRLMATGPVATVRFAAMHLVRRSFPLRFSTDTRRWSDRPAPDGAIRWLGPITVRHCGLEALLCHPDSGLEYRVSVVPGSRFVAHCAVSPQVWDKRPSAIDFRVEIRSDARGWTRSGSVRVDVTRRVRDRRWKQIAIELPRDLDPGGEPVVVTLSTSLVAGGTIEHAWALFGEPHFEFNRRVDEVRQSIYAFYGRVRTTGLREALRQAQGASTVNQEAELYGAWLAKHTPSESDLAAMRAEAAAFPSQPLISVVTPVYNTDPKWLRACIESVRSQAYPNWELCIADDASTKPETIAALREYESDPRIHIRYLKTNAKISAATNAALEAASGEFVALLDHDDELTPDALFHVVGHLNAHPDADVIYSDEDKLDLAGRRCDPYFKPDWSPEHFLTCMYTCHLMVARRSLLDRIGRFRTGFEGAQDYDVVLRLMEVTDRIHHIPNVLYHWRKLPQSTASAGRAKPWALDAGRAALEDFVKRNAMAADVLPGGGPGLYRVRRKIAGDPLVSIVIPTAGKLQQVGRRQVDLVATCVRSIAQKTSYPNYELILVADAGGVQPGTQRALEGTRHRVLGFNGHGPFNFSRKVNYGVGASSGEHIVLCNDDLEVMASEWLTSMLEYSQQREIGAVGAKLVYPDGRLQHVGMVLGVNGVAAHAFHQHPGSSRGYASGAICVRNYSAVTGACMMTRREVFDRIGGFDEEFPIDFNDVDYCLRLRQAGYRVVFTPYAQLYHHESTSFGPRAQDEAGLKEMMRRWGAAIEADPYYNPNLTRDYPDYRIRV